MNRLIKIRLKFNEMIKNINNAIFVAANEILINEKWNCIEKENFETFDYFYNSKNAQITSLAFRNRLFAILISVNLLKLSINYVKKSDELNTCNITLSFQIFKSTNNYSFDIFSLLSTIFFYLNHTQL